MTIAVIIFASTFLKSFRVRTSWRLLGHAISSIQGQDGVLGQRLLGIVLHLSGATVVTEQVQVSLS